MLRVLLGQGWTSETAVSTTIRFGAREAEDHERHWTKSRAISVAQQIGLPPPTANMALMWPESEEDSFETGPSSAENRDILLHHLEPDQDQGAALDIPSSPYAVHPGSSGNLPQSGEPV